MSINRLAPERTLLLRYLRIYWIVGTTKQMKNAVSDPPCSGWSSTFALGEPGADEVRLFCPWSMRSFSVRFDAPEITTAVDLTDHLDWPEVVQRLANAIRGRWNTAWPHATDREAAARVLSLLGSEAPAEADAPETPARESSDELRKRKREWLRAKRADPSYRAQEAKRRLERRHA